MHRILLDFAIIVESTFEQLHWRQPACSEQGRPNKSVLGAR